MTAELCAYHEQVAGACLTKNGHQDDSAIADRLRADLARACTPRFCNAATDNQETR